MTRSRALVLTLALLAAASLAWGARNALRKSDDLMRRAEEVALFVERRDPYADPDMTYPPQALVVFTPLIAPFDPQTLRFVWLSLNLAATFALGWLLVRIYGADRSATFRRALFLVACASKPVRLGIGMGQFHALPVALTLASILAMEADRGGRSALALAIASIKPTMTLPVWLIPTIRRRWPIVLVAGGLHIAAWLGVAWRLDRSPLFLLREWLALAGGQRSAGLIDLPSLLAALGPEFEPYGTAAGMAVLTVGGALMVIAAGASNAALTAFATALAAVFAYHRPYDMTLLLPSLALAARDTFDGTLTPKLTRKLAVLAAGALFIVPTDPMPVGPARSAVELAFGVAAYGLLVHAARRMLTESAAVRRPVPSDV